MAEDQPRRMGECAERHLGQRAEEVREQHQRLADLGQRTADAIPRRS